MKLTEKINKQGIFALTRTENGNYSFEKSHYSLSDVPTISL